MCVTRLARVPREPRRQPFLWKFKTRALFITESTSESTSWDKKNRRWQAKYCDAHGRRRGIGRFDTQEAAARAYNAAIRALPPDVQRRRRTNPVIDGQLVPRARKKRRREESGAANAPARARTEE